MGLRVDLQAKLESSLGSRNVYFQPPNGLAIKYPCIVYELSSMDTRYADDIPYHFKKRYTVTVIDRNPESDIPNKIRQYPLSRFDRFFVSDNLNHFVFDLYF